MNSRDAEALATEVLDAARCVAEAPRAAQNGSWELDPTTLEANWSAQTFRIVEIDPAQTAGLFEALTGRLHPDDRQRSIDRLERAIAEGSPLDDTTRLVMPDGRVKQVRLRAELLRADADPSARPARMVGIIEDITGTAVRSIGTTQALSAQAHAEQRLQSVLDGVFSFVGIFDLDGNLLERNRASFEAMGTPRDSVIGKPFWEGAPWTHSREMQDSIRSTLGRAARGEVVRVDLRGHSGDGRFIDIDAFFGPLFDASGRIEGVIGSGVDVTERRRAEEALKASERQLSVIYANITGILFYVDIEPGDQFRFVSVNPAFLEATGLSQDRVLGKLVQDVIPQPALTQVLEHYREAIRTNRTVHWEEVSEYPAGKKFGEVEVTPVFDSNGAATQLIGMVHDVTARKRAEDALRDADRRKDEFIAVLSHELRNPLAAIRNSIFVLERATGGGDQSRRLQAIIDRQVTHLSRLVDDLLDVTRISHGKIQLQLERLEFGELVRKVVEDQRDAFVKQGIQLADTLPAEPIWLAADATRVAQVITNLLANAAKFTHRGGRVELSVRRDGDAVLLCVRDDGVGIEPDVIGQLFQPFTQAAQTLDRSRGGLGLGLALVKGLVELHGGSVSVSSEGVGRGAEFAVRFPTVTSAAVEAVPAPASHPPHRRRVLVIEDNVEVADTLEQALEVIGHDVRVAHDGPTGLAEAKQFRPEVVLCDIGLPGMSGYDVGIAMRADEDLRGAVLVALSGYALPEDRQRSAASGFVRHLAKPVSLEVLEHVVDTL